METLSQLRIVAQWVFIAAVGAAALRFGVVAWDAAAVEEFVPRVRERKPSALPEDIPTNAAEGAQEAPAQPVGTDERVRVMLSVSYSRGPATVFINGQPMGATAFVGEFTCQSGEELTIRIQPERGAAIEGVRACEAGFITIAQ